MKMLDVGSLHCIALHCIAVAEHTSCRNDGISARRRPAEHAIEMMQASCASSSQLHGFYHLKKYSMIVMEVTALNTSPDKMPKTNAGQIVDLSFLRFSMQ